MRVCVSIRSGSSGHQHHRHHHHHHHHQRRPPVPRQGPPFADGGFGGPYRCGYGTGDDLRGFYEPVVERSRWHRDLHHGGGGRRTYMDFDDYDDDDDDDWRGWR